MASRADRWARALSAGLRGFALWYATGTLVLAQVAEAEALLPVQGLPRVLLPAAGSALTIAGGLLLAPRLRRLRAVRTLACTALMLAGFVVYLLAVHQGALADHDTASFALSFFKAAIVVFLVGAGRRWAPLVLATGSVLVLEAVCAVLGPRLGYPWAPDWTEFAWLGLVAIASVSFAVARRRADAVAGPFARAADEDALRQTRGIARSRAAAVVHDTVLNDLAVLATSPPGRLPEPLAARLAATLELLGSPDWLAPAVPAGDAAPSTVGRAVEQAAAAGLDVRLDGDVDALAGLDPLVERALGGAVDQCLGNIHRHANTGSAEVTVLAADEQVSVMVADAGRGFVEGAVDEDRLGLRGSVRSRIEDVGGSVRIFTRPGIGTTVLLTVPAPVRLPTEA